MRSYAYLWARAALLFLTRPFVFANDLHRLPTVPNNFVSKPRFLVRTTPYTQVIFGEGKTTPQIRDIFNVMGREHAQHPERNVQNVVAMATRISQVSRYWNAEHSHYVPGATFRTHTESNTCTSPNHPSLSMSGTR